METRNLYLILDGSMLSLVCIVIYRAVHARRSEIPKARNHSAADEPDDEDHRRVAQSGRIDDVVHLKRQKIWVDPSQIFYKDNVKAGHAQISTDCPAGKKVCNPSERTGDNFLNQCQDDAARRR
jgi:hypothetical protein